ncbi:hypothetical protein A8C56_09705 [Niabella ginsenosidivorans]|uniref:RagB/SusD domain-containing protein n=1 Tax=Niabella ginsenosidivorans TaxID=1176587 RepID=A0A1A9I3G1_9BACT|nr:RagB/SusD family nutrient uptake outer membrane protein [Niabella ginsenosidivorans]ANH81221.1 hypothetical protein A8C56_09705 [Niabella ginsenosidivorans]
MKKIFKSVIIMTICMSVLQGCSIDPEYYSQVSPSNFFDSQDKVYQRFARPFTSWATYQGGVPYARFTVLNTLASDELLMPNRNGDWYDGGFYLNHFTHQFSPATDGYWNYTWDAISESIAQAWSAVEDIDKNVDFDALGFPEGIRESMLNQIKVLVAYFYMIGLDAFGGMPLYTSNQTELQSRATDKQTFEFIEGLLLEALPTLPKKASGDAEKGYVSQGTAAALLAKLYFNARPYTGEEMYTKCAEICTKIKNGEYGPYALAGSYQEIFGFSNATSPELMWVVPSENSKREVGGGTPQYSTHYNTWMYLDNPGAMSWNGLCLLPSQDINGKHYLKVAGNLGGPFKLGSPYDKFEATDLRKKNYVYNGNGQYTGMFLAGVLTNPHTGVSCIADGSREYPKGTIIPMVDQVAQLAPDPNGTRYPNGRKEGALYGEENSGVRLLKHSPIPNEADNALRFNPEVPVIRFTEIQYMLAECKWRLGDKPTAANLINEVRKRYFAGGNDPNPATAGNLDEYRFLDEWLIEFIGEGRRRTDLVRWNKFTTEAWWDHPADGPGKEYLNRFPVPASAINANPKLEQNPGYK